MHHSLTLMKNERWELMVKELDQIPILDPELTLTCPKEPTISAGGIVSFITEALWQKTNPWQNFCQRGIQFSY